MPLQASQPARVLGCDVGKATVVVFDSHTQTTCPVPNTDEALGAWIATLDSPGLIVCEATGGYEAPLLRQAVQAGCPAHRADARKVKAFVRSFGTLGKTDRLDARALARYGLERHASLPRWQAPDAQRDRLQHLVLTRRDLVAERQAFLNRQKAPGATPVADVLQDVIACLTQQIARLDARIKALLDHDAALGQAAAVLQAIPGIGPATAAALIALMPELGHINRRQAAALAGLAPHPNQSGQADRYRPTRGGRPEVRRTLFMAALTAARHNPALRDFGSRLKAAGKKPIVAITAVMRKLIVIANAKLRDQLKASQQLS